MPGIGDDDWEDFGEDEPTRADPPPEVQAVPVPVPPTDTTGRYGTLVGYEVARETVERIAVARGRTTERAFVLASLRFFLVDLGSNLAGADDLVQRFHAWLQKEENQRLVTAALGWDKNPP
jgi:hypothetical protein